MRTFNEDTRVKFPATAHFLRLGYEYQPISEGEIDFETKIFRNRFKPAIERINGRTFDDAEISAVLSEINSTISNNDLGKSFYNWLVNPEEKVKLIDFDNIENNDFAVVTELPFSVDEKTEEGSFRPDINILVNGIPLAFLEVKKPDNEGGIQVEFNRMINQRFRNEKWKKYFHLLQMITFSNNMEYEDDDSADSEDVKCGSFYTTPNGENTTFSFFREDINNYHDSYNYAEVTHDTIARILEEESYDPAEADTPEFQTNLSVDTPCNRFITSMYDKERFLYFLHYGLMYLTETKKIKDDEGRTIEEIPVPQKHIMRYPQFFATRAIIRKLENGGKGGIIWHTQGSGKTALAAFSNRVLKDYYAKQGINLKMFFIVDRLDLLNQSTNEFTDRNFNVVNCNSKTEFAKELNRALPKTKEDTIGTICVVNIQKFMDDYGLAKNDYDLKVQRVFFIDEAHRSYSKGTGEFYKNLMTCDPNGVFIAMTGTPLLTKKERSNLRFGDYIHKYFYDKSIADGYTLRIKKEEIETVAKQKIKANLDIENQNLDSQDVYESDDFVENLSKFIEEDFKNFRFANSDPTIGGMIVCRSNHQAKMVEEWFKKNSKLTVGFVISDSENAKQAIMNKNYQDSFKYDNTPDLLVVHYMLTTGYDVKRLKKMYLLRAPKAHNLLQTISRVNRPYRNKKLNKTYKYGYIVDFVDIENEYNTALQDYIKELEDDAKGSSDDDYSLTGLIVDKNDIQKRYLEYKEKLKQFHVDTDNMEEFSRELSQKNKETLLQIKKILNGIRDCEIEFKLSNAQDLAAQIDSKMLKTMLSSVQHKIDFINLKTAPIDTLAIMNNKDVIEVLYEFLKAKVEVIDYGFDNFDESSETAERFKQAVKNVQAEIQRNKNKDDIKIRKLEDLIKQIFEELKIVSIEQLTLELEKAGDEARRINDENERLAARYGNHFSFVRTYQDTFVKYEDIDKSDAEQLLSIVYEHLKDKLRGDALVIQGKQAFVASVKKDVTKELFKTGLYSKVKGYLGDILSDLYTNLQLYSL